MLLAIESSNENGIGSHLSINPGNSVRVESGTRGFFIAGSFEEIKRAYFYCEFCHKNVIDLNKIKQCKCHQGNFFNFLPHNLIFINFGQTELNVISKNIRSLLGKLMIGVILIFYLA